MTTIEVFADIICPFTHVGLRRLSEARHRRHVDVSLRVRAWPLEWINGELLTADTVEREIDALRARVAPDLFAGFDPAIFPLTSISALGLATAAYAVDDATGAAMSMALRDALFERGEDVSDPDVLWAIGRRFDLDPLSREDSEIAVRAEWDQGKARGVQGSPHFFVGDRSWFCPSLRISHAHEQLDIEVADDTMREFYAAALA